MPGVPGPGVLQWGRSGSVQSASVSQVVVQTQMGIGPMEPQHSQLEPAPH